MVEDLPKEAVLEDGEWHIAINDEPNA